MREIVQQVEFGATVSEARRRCPELSASYHYPRSACIGDYDLERVNGNLMTFGYRTENMCTLAGQPTQAQTAWVKRVSPQQFQG